MSFVAFLQQLLANLADVGIASPANNQVLVYNSSTGRWENKNIGVVGVSSLNTLEGALSITTPNSTLLIGTSGSDITADLNLANPNTWTALQTFTAGLTVSAGVITFDTVPQASQNGSTQNTGFGTGALSSNTGNANAAFGFNALELNATGSNNSAFGFNALQNNTAGGCTAVGTLAAGLKTTGPNVTAIGTGALENCLTGHDNTALGYHAGYGYTGSENSNIVIGSAVLGTAGESNVIRIGNIFLDNLQLKSNGVPGEYGSTLTTAVAIGTSPTTINTILTTQAGQYLVVVSVEASVASTLSSLTVTYNDFTSGARTTQTLATSVAIALNSAVTFVALCNSINSQSIIVTATAAAASDLYGSATIFSL